MTPSTRKSVRKTAGGPAAGFTAEEREAMRERTRELKAATRAGKADGEREVLAKIAAMPEPDRAMAGRLHALVKAHAPGLLPKTWYGMPAYADGQGRVVCFFQGRYKFKARYATLGFSDKARLDDGDMWPASFALAAWSAAVEARIAALLKQAAA